MCVRSARSRLGEQRLPTRRRTRVLLAELAQDVVAVGGEDAEDDDDEDTGLRGRRAGTCQRRVSTGRRDRDGDSRRRQES